MEKGLVQSFVDWVKRPFGDDNEPDLIEVAGVTVFVLTVAYMWNKVLNVLD